MTNRFLSILFALTLTLNCFAQNSEQILPKFVAEGHYFGGEMSMAEMPNDKFAFSLIKDNEGHRAFLLLPMSDDAVIPESFSKYEIPKEKVKNLSQFEEAANLIIGMNKATKANGPELVEGNPLPGDFQLNDLDGNVWKKTNLAGKVVVVNVWYSGCGPCRKEMPILSTWKDENPDVLFLSANYQAPDIVKRVADKEGFNWTHLVNDNYFTKWVGNLGYPLTIIIGSDGNVKKAFHGTNETIRSEILEEIKKLKK